jgi:TolB-like protein
MIRCAVALTVALASAPGGAAAVRAPQVIAPLASARILVMPFENVTRDARIFWLSEAAAVLLTDDLNALGVGAITRTERQQAFERLQVPPAAVLTDATIIRIGQLVGASQVVVGSLQMEGDSVAVRARSIALDTGERHGARAAARAVRDLRADRAPDGARFAGVAGGRGEAASARHGVRGVHQRAAR